MYSASEMYDRVREIAKGADMDETQKALPFAWDKHKGQRRKSGAPYIVHPLTMARDALALGVRDDALVATILLHDVCEDCGVLPWELPVGQSVRISVSLVTFTVEAGETKDAAMDRYFGLMSEDRSASLTKLFDRYHNLSTMAGVFSLEKQRSYIDETRAYVLPLLHEAENRWPQDDDLLFELEYRMTGMVDLVDENLRAADM